jgi:hypothetical protein
MKKANSKVEMKDHYDFSKGVRGKFVISADEIVLPHYLPAPLESRLRARAQILNKTPEEVLRVILDKELDVLAKLG